MSDVYTDLLGREIKVGQDVWFTTSIYNRIGVGRVIETGHFFADAGFPSLKTITVEPYPSFDVSDVPIIAYTTGSVVLDGWLPNHLIYKLANFDLTVPSIAVLHRLNGEHDFLHQPIAINDSIAFVSTDSIAFVSTDSDMDYGEVIGFRLVNYKIEIKVLNTKAETWFCLPSQALKI